MNRADIDELLSLAELCAKRTRTMYSPETVYFDMAVGMARLLKAAGKEVAELEADRKLGIGTFSAWPSLAALVEIGGAK